MKLKTLMIIKAIVCLSFGFLLLVFPEALLNILGASVGAGGLFMARAYGASLTGNMFLTWYAKDAGKSTARRAIILDLFIYDAIGFVVTLLNVLAGVLNFLGWGIVAVYLFFTLGYGYFWFKGESILPSD
ncbi:MAG: hypothetical protein ABFQ89_02345 [Chloroflexota bacterium]